MYVRSLSYKSKQRINFIDGKFLIYKSRFSFSRSLRDYALYMLAIGFFSYLIYEQVSMHNSL
jgi:hypothetical protein